MTIAITVSRVEGLIANYVSTPTNLVTINGCTAGDALFAIIEWTNVTNTISQIAVNGESNMTLGTLKTSTTSPGNRSYQAAVIPVLAASGNKTLSISMASADAVEIKCYVLTLSGVATSAALGAQEIVGEGYPSS